MFPKQSAGRSPHYRDMARGQDCMLRIPGVCCGDPQTTVLAHSNQALHGKGMSLKASDWYGVWACHTCHTHLDQGKATREQKAAMFDQGLARMEARLRKIAADLSAKKKDRDTAAWAVSGMAS